jgi:hypothetical protein
VMGEPGNAAAGLHTSGSTGHMCVWHVCMPCSTTNHVYQKTKDPLCSSEWKSEFAIDKAHHLNFQQYLLEMHTSARRLLVFSSCCAFLVACSLIISNTHETTTLCSTKCFSSLVLPDDSAGIAAAKASMELDASVRHRKIQDSLDDAEAQGNAIAARIRSEAAAFLAKVLNKANATSRDSSAYSSASTHPPLCFFVALLAVCFAFSFQ